MKLKKIASFLLISGLFGVSQVTWSHTSFDKGAADESERVYISAVISGGCPKSHDDADAGTNPVIASSIVFPDGVDSILKKDAIGGEVLTETLSDFIAWNGTNHIVSKDVFKKSEPVLGAGGKVIGSHSWGGKLPGADYIGLVPLRVNSVAFTPDTADKKNCATSVTFRPAIVYICKRVSVDRLDVTNVRRWTPDVPGSLFTAESTSHDYNGATTFTVNRTTPLDGSCGAGFKVFVEPSGEQINRDLPIPRFWPMNYKKP